jgi:hypothetical protein
MSRHRTWGTPTAVGGRDHRPTARDAAGPSSGGAAGVPSAVSGPQFTAPDRACPVTGARVSGLPRPLSLTQHRASHRDADEAQSDEEGSGGFGDDLDAGDRAREAAKNPAARRRGPFRSARRALSVLILNARLEARAPAFESPVACLRGGALCSGRLRAAWRSTHEPRSRQNGRALYACSATEENDPGHMS